MLKKNLILILFFIFFSYKSYSSEINKINISGNERITKESIIIFGEINLSDDFNDNKLNQVLKNLYETNFFEDIKLYIEDKELNIVVVENPIIQDVKIEGIKSQKMIDPIFNLIKLKKNNSFNEYLVKKDRDVVINVLRSNGYYFAKVNLKKIDNLNNTVSLIYEVDLGKKAKIRKIRFIGDKKYKNRRLFRIIVSEEDKFWKFISRDKLLNQARIDLDTRLLTNYYKNKGYYNIVVETTFAEFLDNGMFDLTFKINAGEKFYFNDIKLNLPDDYNEKNFSRILSLFQKLKNEPYSFNSIEKIIKEVEIIALKEEYESINANVEEIIVGNNKLNFSIFIDESPKYLVERINLMGNNITREEVVRNSLILDEGDTFNKILHTKSINNLKSLNFFKSVESEIIQGSTKAKILSMLCILGAFCCLVMVLQGFHLWGTWEVPQIDSSDAARISTKARGRGGIILLLIRFFPQFLVFGYGFWGWQLKPYIRRAFWLWG